MKKGIKILMIIALVLENIALFYVANFYFQHRQYQAVLKTNKGLTEACKTVALSESLVSVLQKLNDFPASIQESSNKVYLRYGDEWMENAGTTFVFSEDFKLTNKACNADWEPTAPNFMVK